MDRSDTAFHIKAVIDTFSTTTQGLIGAVQPVLVPAELTGTLSSTGLTLNDSAFATSCSTAESLLKIDLNNLLIYFPTQLVPGSSWRDSVSSTGCQGGLTSNSYSVRTYTVQGQMDFQGIPVVIVQRVDTLSAHGEGAQQQHQVTFDATGTGSARYLVDTSRGRVVYLTTEQRLVFAVKASARTSSFTQLSKQDYRLTP